MTVIVGSDVDLPIELVAFTLEQGSWPWMFDEVARRAGAGMPDPVLLFWPLYPDSGDGPALADADTGELAGVLLDESRYAIRMVERRLAERLWRGWPDTKAHFASGPVEAVEEQPLKPLSRPAGQRRSPFDPS